MPTLFPSSHAANLLVLKNGDALCFWFSGAGEGHSNGIAMSRLAKESQQWSTPIEVDHQDARSFAFQVASGRIWLLHTSQVAGQWQTKATVEYLTSGDDGKTWSKAKTLFGKPGSFVRQPPILLTRSTGCCRSTTRQAGVLPMALSLTIQQSNLRPMLERIGKNVQFQNLKAWCSIAF